MTISEQSLSALAQIGDQVITADEPLSIERFKQYVDDIKTEQDHAARWSALENTATQLARLLEMSSGASEIIWEAMSNDINAWKTAYSSFMDMQSIHITIKEAAENAQKLRNYRIEALRGIRNAGILNEDWTTILPPGDPAGHSSTLLRAARAMVSKLSELRLTPSEGIRALNHQVITRISAHQRGGTAFQAVSTTDYQKTAKLTSEQVRSTPNHTDAEFTQLGLVRAPSGLIQSATGVQQVSMIAEVSSANQSPALLPPGSGPNIFAEQLPLSTSKRLRSSSPPPAARPTPVEDDGGGDVIQADEPAAGPRRSKRLRNDAVQTTHVEDDGDIEDNEDADFVEDPQPREPVDSTRCRCSPDVAAAWKQKITRQNKQSPIIKAITRRIAVTRQYKDLVDAGASICHKHTKAACTAVGLRTRITGIEMNERLLRYADSRTSIGQLHTDNTTYKWFNTLVRPKHPEEYRGAYKYDAAAAPIEFQPAVDAIKLGIEAKYKLDFQATFYNIGSVHIPAFSWWFGEKVGTWDGQEVSIGDLAHIEFDMYLWHLRTDAGNSGSLGWLRNMYHSGIQQLMRMDPEYYRCYVALRPDHHWRLISYPYYAKYSRAGDRTFFRHIDVNVSQYLIDGRGGNMIQGTVSLDDEAIDMCTEIIPGLHTRDKISDWCSRVKDRLGKGALDDWVSRIQDKKVWSDEDKKHFGVDFTPFPCKKGDARITSPLLPHGATTMPDREGVVRRTMLPWFVGIQADHSAMEIIDMGTWEELSYAHVSLISASRSPSGKPNHYGTIPYRFPVAMPLKLSSSLSNALVGRERWDMPTTLRELHLVLGQDLDTYESWLREWRKEAKQAYLQHMFYTRDLEMAIFGEKSFWNNGGNINAPAPPADAEATEDIIREIMEFKKSKSNKFVISENHSQKDAASDTDASILTDEALRATDGNITMSDIDESRREKMNAELEDLDSDSELLA
jgi:hypothetical protein